MSQRWESQQKEQGLGIATSAYNFGLKNHSDELLLQNRIRRL
jgi:hypothetical protein